MIGSKDERRRVLWACGTCGDVNGYPIGMKPKFCPKCGTKDSLRLLERDKPQTKIGWRGGEVCQK